MAGVPGETRIAGLARMPAGDGGGRNSFSERDGETSRGEMAEQASCGAERPFEHLGGHAGTNLHVVYEHLDRPAIDVGILPITYRPTDKDSVAVVEVGYGNGGG